jgi:phage tail-like protein
MNVNGSRFHMLMGVEDWGACGIVAGRPTLARKWRETEPDPALPYYDKTAGQLTLLPLVEAIPDTPGEPRFTVADHRAAAADRNGNLYVIADDRLGLIVRSAGDGAVTPFWPPRPRRRRATAAFADAAPDAPTPEPLAGLAVTRKDFLVAGFTADGAAGLLRFDLVGGGPPERVALPAGTIAASLAPTPHGGLWLLDAQAKRLFKLDRDLRLRGRQVTGQPPVFAPEDAEPADAVTTEPIVVDAAAIAAPAAIATLGDGSVLLLDAPEKDPAGLFIIDRKTAVLRPLIRLDFLATCFTVAERDGVPTVLLADAGGNQARRIQLVVRSGRWEADSLSDTLPLRRFGGRALVTIRGVASYDSGATDPIWVPVVETRHRRFSKSAGFVTPIYDGGEPQCVWDRLRLDGCIPPGTQVTIEARAADEASALASAAAAGWAAQPALVLSPGGPELPGKRALAAIETNAAIGKGSWGLLLQNIVGRYAQLRITLGGDERVTPHLRGLRLWYPRFSYVQRFLPGVYREEPVSASFLERFLANFEGINTGIEDRIATAEALFDPRVAPAAMLEWLASWYEVALDPSLDERRRRLFIAHAAAFFGWRGTIRGLQLALKIALDPAITAEDFDLDRPECVSPRAIRIVEAYRSRVRGRRFAAPEGMAAPGLRSLDADWVPEEGSAGLWARWPEQPAPAGRFPLFPPAGKDAAWIALVRKQFGFEPGAGRGERARWQAFQTAIGRASPAADLPVSATEDWRRYAALPSHDRRLWQDFLRARYRNVDRLNAAHDTGWDDFALVPLPDHLPATPAATRDWLGFEGQELPIDRTAHRFSVLLPRTRVDVDPAVEADRQALARRIVALEKPAHTVFDVRFYWAMNRVGEARLGLDSAIGEGSRAPELVPGAVLGRAYVGAAFVGGPRRPPRGRERIAC